jgi:hypothetical protein
MTLPVNRRATFKGCGTVHRITQPMMKGTEVTISAFLRPNASSIVPHRRHPAICERERMLAATKEFV